jgi:hypothetical protein
MRLNVQCIWRYSEHRTSYGAFSVRQRPMLAKSEDILRLWRRIQQLLVFEGIDARFVAGLIGMVFVEFTSSEAMKR